MLMVKVLPHVQWQVSFGRRNLDFVLDVVEARGLALDPNLVGSEVEIVGTMGRRNLNSFWMW